MGEGGRCPARTRSRTTPTRTTASESRRRFRIVVARRVRVQDRSGPRGRHAERRDAPVRQRFVSIGSRGVVWPRVPVRPSRRHVVTGRAQTRRAGRDRVQSDRSTLPQRNRGRRTPSRADSRLVGDGRAETFAFRRRRFF